MNITIELLKSHATSGEVILRNLSDLEIDVEQFESWQNKGVNSFLWLVKESGTILLPLRSAVNPVFCDCAFDVPCSAYEVNVRDGSIQSVSKSRAVELIAEFPFDPDYHEITGDLEFKVRGLLKEKYVTDNMVNRAYLDAEDSPLLAWYEYFKGIGNRLMSSLLSITISKLERVN